MLGSFDSSSHEEEDDPAPPLDSHHHHRFPPRNFICTTTPAIHLRQLLINCAHLISQSNLSSARRLLTLLIANSFPYGDSTERLVHLFTKAISLRLNRQSAVTPNLPEDADLLQSSYLSLNQVTPFIRFSHLTANQAILEAINEAHESIHILDFDIMHGVQWPPLMQALAERYPRPTLRITGAGCDPNVLRRTGDRLSKFALTLGLNFQFHPLLHVSTNDGDDIAPPALLLPDETLAVNIVHCLHRLIKKRDRLHLFLRRIKAMNPKVVTVSEREANHNHPLFLERFAEAYDHYSALFSSLEATLPPNSRERLAVEQVWFGREITDILAAEGDGRRERHERYKSWEVTLRSSGFKNVPLSPFALSQAKLLLRLHYPTEGYQLHIFNDSFFLGWLNHPLFSVSSWH